LRCVHLFTTAREADHHERARIERTQAVVRNDERRQRHDRDVGADRIATAAREPRFHRFERRLRRELDRRQRGSTVRSCETDASATATFVPASPTPPSPPSAAATTSITSAGASCGVRERVTRRNTRPSVITAIRKKVA
jgi:hypothetical protein